MNLKVLRQKQGLTQALVAEKMGLSRASYTNMENGRRGIEASQLIRLSEILNCSTDEILGTPSSPARNSQTKIPVLDNVRAGVPINDRWIVMGEEEIGEDLAGQGTFFAFRAEGDCMAPVLMEGDLVIVRQQAFVESGEIALLLIKNEHYTIQRVVLLGSGMVLIPGNTSYPPTVYSLKQVRDLPVEIIGRVVEMRRNF